MTDDKTLKVTVDIDSMTWGDMRLLIGMNKAGGATNEDELIQLIGMFDRFVEGGADAVPITSTGKAIQKINEAIAGLVNSKNLSSSSPPTSGRAKKRLKSTSS